MSGIIHDIKHGTLAIITSLILAWYCMPVLAQEGRSLAMSYRSNTAVVDAAATPDTVPTDSTYASPFRHWRITTNALYWAALTWNCGLEYAIDNRNTIWLQYDCAWWSQLADKKVYCWMDGELDYHHYFQNINDGKHKGFFMGAYAQVGEFEFMVTKVNRKGEFVAGGLCGGYRWQLKNRWSMLTKVGIGYMGVKYKFAHSIKGTLIGKGNATLNYFGPTNAALSFIYEL